MHSWGLSSLQVLLSVCGQHQTREAFSIAPYPNQVCLGCEQGLGPQHHLSTCPGQPALGSAECILGRQLLVGGQASRAVLRPQLPTRMSQY